MSDNTQTITGTSLARAWIESLRLRTLSLACASIMTGSALAWWQGQLSTATGLLALLTTCLLQILSNLANDYGDARKGSDTPDRIGPLRGMQKGVISQQQMRNALVLTVALTMISGVWLVVHASQSLNDIFGFITLGGIAIVAAIAYTVGKKPYGYLGLGDASVLIFFGWLGVAGSNYLQTHHLPSLLFLPATTCGLMAVAVLNVNNMRDIESDRLHGKYTLAVRLGAVGARRYHCLLLGGSLLCCTLFALLASLNPGGWLFLLAIPMLFTQARHILREGSAEAMRPMLAKTVKSALLLNLLFSLGLLLN